MLAFLPDERERAIYYAMAGAYREGVADRRIGGGDAEATEEVEAAFRAFREACAAKAYEADSEGTLETLRSGRHPAGDLAWVTMGSFMAAALTAGDPSAFTALHHGGELGFFKAYVDHYQANRRQIPKKLRFPKELEQTIEAWAADWRAVWTPELRALIVSDSVDPGQLLKTLSAAFEGRTLVPDYSPELVGMAEDAFQGGRQMQGFSLAQTALELYPEAERTNGLWGVVMATMGQADQARQHLKKAAAINSRGYAGVDNLMQIAQYFQSTGLTPAARTLFEIAAEIHPESEEVKEALAALTESSR